MIVTELSKEHREMLRQLQQYNHHSLKSVFVTKPLKPAIWIESDRPSCWQFQERNGEYTLFVDHAWGNRALFKDTVLLDIWTFNNVIKPFPKLGFVIIQDNVSSFNSWFFVPANKR